jgi:hypothetical protein
MILDKSIKIEVNSGKTIHKLLEIGIMSNIGDSITIDISKLWHGSNLPINVKCDICGNEKSIQYNLYNKNIKKHNFYCCCNKCSYIKNRKTCKEMYGYENYVNIEKSKKTKLEKYGDENYQNIEKIKKTKFEKYGDENYNNLDKIKKTNLERYGVESTLNSNIVKEKSKKTNLERYGNEDCRRTQLIINKRIKTTNERYGVEFYAKTDEYKLKVKETSLKKYGVDSPNKSDAIKSKKILSMIDKYGFISNSCSDESKNKLRETNFKKYGVEYPMQVVEFAEKQQKNSKKINYYNENLYYQSSYEKHFLDYIYNIGIIDELKRGPSIKYEFENEERMHFPDFYLEKINLIIEIKSDYYYTKYLDKNISKMKKCIEIGYNYLFIINKNYKAFDEIIKHDSHLKI